MNRSSLEDLSIGPTIGDVDKIITLDAAGFLQWVRQTQETPGKFSLKIKTTRGNA